MIKKSIAAGFGALFLFLLVSYPLIFRLGSSVFAIPEWPFDTYGTLYGVWWLRTAFEQGISPGFNPLLAHPFGLDWSLLPVQPLLIFPLLLFSLIGGEIFAYNLFLILNFALTGGIAFALCYYCTGHTRGSLLGALIFTFSSNHLIQSMTHIGFSAVQWVPLFVLSALYLWEKRNFRSVLFCALSVCILFWSNYYFFYFSLFFIFCMVVFGLLSRQEMQWKRFLFLLALAGLLCGVFTAPQWIPLAKNYFLKQSTAEVRASGYVRSHKDLIKYAARPSDYLLPSEHNPFLSEVTEWYQKNISKKGRHWSDRTLYLGWIPLLLAVSLFFFWRKLSVRDRFLTGLFFVSALFYFWLSLSPWIQIGGTSFPTPSALLYKIAPMFRYYSRAGFFVGLFVSILAAYCWKYFPVKFKTEHVKNGICSLTAILILLEFTVVPPARSLDLTQIPPVYTWLKNQPGDFAIVEYPFVRSIDERQQKYMFYQRLHGKKLINGGDEGTLADMLRKKARDIESAQMWSLLKYYGTGYVLVHRNQERFRALKTLQPVKRIGEVDVYQIQAPPEKLHHLLWNFGQAEKDSEGDAWRWIGKTAKIWILNTQTEEAETALSFQIRSPGPNKLEWVLNGEKLEAAEYPAQNKKSLKVKLNLKLKPGENILEFLPDKMLPHPRNPKRKISFQVSGITFQSRR